MDTSSGQIFETPNSVMRAIERGDTNPGKLVGIPKEYASMVLGMSRSERRRWYKENKKKLNLPAWGTN